MTRVNKQSKREVDELWKKLQQTPIEKSHTLETRKSFEKAIMRRALGKFVPQLSEKEEWEMKNRRNVSDVIWKVIVHMDGDYDLEKLKGMCRERNLPISRRDKKELALEILTYEVEKAK